MQNNKTIIIVAAAAVVIVLLLFFKKSSRFSSTETNSSGNSLTKSMLQSATDAVCAAELSEEDEEYNLLRQEYSDRYGVAAKTTWTKKMIQQKIDEYDEKSELLDQLVAISGESRLEDTTNMSADEIMRLIESEIQKSKEEFNKAQEYYRAATGKNPDKSLDSILSLKEAVENEMVAAMNEYVTFTSESVPSGLTTALEVRTALNTWKKTKREQWEASKNYINGRILTVSSALKNKAKVSNKPIIEECLVEANNWGERDFYYWFENLYKNCDTQGRNLFSELNYVANSIIYNASRRAAASAVLNRRNNNYRFFTIDEYGRII